MLVLSLYTMLKDRWVFNTLIAYYEWYRCWSPGHAIWSFRFFFFTRCVALIIMQSIHHPIIWFYNQSHCCCLLLAGVFKLPFKVINIVLYLSDDDGSGYSYVFIYCWYYNSSDTNRLCNVLIMMMMWMYVVGYDVKMYVWCDGW